MPENKVCAVVVTFHPAARHIEHLAMLRPQVESLVVVDNGSTDAELTPLRAACATADIALLENGANLGIGAALNQGVRWGLEHRQEWVLLLDQDSTVTDGFVASMMNDFHALQGSADVLQMIPRYRDPDTGGEEQVPAAADGGPFITRTSGSFFPARAFDLLGLFTEELFIYCVDDDYSLRLRSRGYRIVQSGNAVLLHSAGKPTPVSVLGRRFVTRNYRPEIQYYWARNRVWLMRKWGGRYPHLILSSLRSLLGIPLKILAGETTRGPKIRMFLRGIVDGILGRTGPRVVTR